MNIMIMFTKQLPRFILFCICTLVIFLSSTQVSYSALPPTGYMTVSWPISRSVFQRNSANQATIFFAGQFFYTSTLECPTQDFYYQVEKLNLETGAYVSVERPWTQFFIGNENTGLFQATISNLPGGWYNLKVKATSGGSGGTVNSSATIKFGVGDVFVVAGQSNAQSPGVQDGYNDNSYLTTDSWDCVNVHNYDGACKPETDQFPTMVKLINQANPSFRTGPSGFNSWYYSPLGKQIAQNYGVPTAFFNSAIGGTSVLNWQDGAQGLTTYLGTNYLCSAYGTSMSAAQGQPYRTLKNILKYYAKIFGVKAVLWHQGEADTNAGTSSSTYKSRLEYVINQSRTDFGSANLVWYVARASYTNSTTSANVIAGQNSVISTVANVKAGAATDIIPQADRWDNTHFWKNGLTSAATAWRQAIYAYNGNQFTAGPPPLANFQLSLANYPLVADGGYSVYNWNSRTAPTATTQSITGNGRCFVRDASGNWRITPEYVRGSFCGLNGARISAETAQEEMDLSYSFLIKSNPVTDKTSTISFNVPYEANVTLEVMDISGRPIKQLANGVHAPGKYSYPIWLSNSPAGTYICVLQIDGVSLTKRFVFSK